LAGAAWVCVKVPNCDTTTSPPPSGSTTQPPTTVVPNPDLQFCVDSAGRRYLVGTFSPSADGCSFCKCGYEYTNGTVSSQPTWICNPTYGQENSRCCNVSGVIIRPGSFAIDRVACKNCTCGPNGLTCTTLSLCSMCDFNGTKYAQGEVRKNPNGCEFCRCSIGANNQPAWECEQKPCDRKCVRLSVVVTLSGADAHYDRATIIAILDTMFGSGNYQVYVATSPDNSTIIISIRCLDGTGAAVDLQTSVETALEKAFSREGQQSDATVNSNIEDAGTVETSSNTSGSSVLAVTFSCLVLLVATLLF